MINFLYKLFINSQNTNNFVIEFKNLRKNTQIEKIYSAIESYSENSKIMYVGGCIRKIIKGETVDDIDLAVNLEPHEVSKALKDNDIKFYETGISHGTITAIIGSDKFEITSLRKDTSTDGRHAKVEFTQDWHQDASRRDFTFNSIYADLEGNLFDPFNGKNNLENGQIIFVGNPEKRIKEDYLRVLRYIRFFLNYSKLKHEHSIIRAIKKNLDGLSTISSERILDEFKKLVRSEGFLKLPHDKECLEIINLIIPQFKKIHIFKKPNDYAKKNIKNVDFIFLISLMVIDGSDNLDYFLYKFNISNKDKARMTFINEFFKNKTNNRTFSVKNLNKILYYNGKQAVLDIISFQIFKSKKIDKQITKIFEIFKFKKIPIMPISAATLIDGYHITPGKDLGNKLKLIEKHWVDNDFEISNLEVQNLVKGT